MPTTPENKKPEGDKTPSTMKKAASAVTSKKNRGLVIAALVVVLGLIGVVFAVVNPDSGDEPDKPTASQSPVEVGVPKESDDPSEEPTKEPEETESETPSDEGERRVETEAPEDNGPGSDATEPDAADYPVGSPKNRGGIPKELPLPDDFQFVSTETENGKTVINGTVGDSHEALMVFEVNGSKDYSVRSRNVDPNKTSGHWAIEGPGMPTGSVLVITPEETLQVRIPK